MQKEMDNEKTQMKFMEEEENIEEQMKEKLVYDERSGFVVCKQDGICMQSLEAIRSHWVNSHVGSVGGIKTKVKVPTKKVAEMLYNEAKEAGLDNMNKKELPKCLGGELETKVHEKYKEAPGSLRQGEKLRAIDFAAFKLGKQCTKCTECFEEEKALEKHLLESHKMDSKEVVEIVAKLPTITMQRLSAKSRKFFPVEVTVEMGMYAEWKKAIDREWLRGDGRGNALQEHIGQAGRDGIWMFERQVKSMVRGRFLKPNQQEEQDANRGEEREDEEEENETDGNEKDFFLRICQFDQILKDAGYKSLEDVPIDLVCTSRERATREMSRGNRCKLVLGDEKDAKLEAIVRRTVEDYFWKASEINKTNSAHVNKIVTPSDQAEENNRRDFAPLSQKKSVARYALETTRIVMMLVRQYIDATEREKSFAIGEEVEEKGLNGVRVSSDLWENTRRFVEIIEVEKKGRRKEPFESNGPKRKKRRVETEVGFEYMDKYEFSEETMLLHSILRSLLLVHEKKTNSTKSFLVRHFTAMCSVQPHFDISKRSYKAPEEISPVMAALTYTASCTGLIELRLRDIYVEEGEGRAECQEKAISELGVQEYEPMGEEEVKQRFSCEKNTAVAYIRYILKRCMTVMKNKIGKIRFFPCKSHKRCGFLDGEEVSLAKLGQAVKVLTEKAKTVLQADILLGMAIPEDFDSIIKSASDNFATAKLGYSILELKSTKESCAEKGYLIFTHICGSEKLRGEWFKNMGEGSSHADNKEGSGWEHEIRQRVEKKTAEKWLDKVQEVQKMLLVIMHIMGGGPARATEIAAFQFENGVGTLRNVFMNQGELYFQSWYNKNDWFRGYQRPIIRVLDKEISKMFIMYYMLVRPFECAVVAILYGADRGKEHRRFLWSNKGSPWKSDVICTTFRKQLVDCDIRLTFAQYRHYQAAMARMFLSTETTRRLLQGDEDGTISEMGELKEELMSMIEDPYPMALPIHEQAGHSRRTADRVYGVGNVHAQGMNMDEMGLQRQASLAWSTLLRRCNQEEHEETISSDRTEYKIGRGHEDGKGVEDAKMERYVKQTVRSLSATIQPSMEKALRSVQANNNVVQKERDIGAKRNIWTPSGLTDLSMHNASRSKPTCVPLGRVQMCTKELRSMFGRNNVSFRNNTQLEALLAILEQKEDVMVVIPTGCGKSLLFQLPAFMGRQRKVVYIVIVPLVSLIQDHKRSCEEKNLKVATWDTKDEIENCNILLLSVEQVGSAEYMTLVTKLVNDERLGSIFFDEAHLTFMWKSFRESLRHLNTRICPGRTPIQRVLLSATVPIEKEKEIAMLHGMDKYEVKRMPTSRANLAYHVKYVEQEKFRTLEDSIVKDLEELIKGKVLKSMNESTSERDEERRCQIIVYCHTVKMVERVHDVLKGDPERRKIQANNNVEVEKGTSSSGQIKREWRDYVDVLHYHAKINSKEKERAYEEWVNFIKETGREKPRGLGKNGKGVQIMVATCAFGTGIDSPKVRMVVHVGFSRHLMAYVQESGRAGRDGKPAKCVVLYNEQFAKSQRSFIKKDAPDIVNVYKAEREKGISMDSVWCPPQVEMTDDDLLGFEKFCCWAQSRTTCRRQMLFSEMDAVAPALCAVENPSNSETWCDNCLDRLDEMERANVDQALEPIMEQNIRRKECNPREQVENKVFNEVTKVTEGKRPIAGSSNKFQIVYAGPSGGNIQEASSAFEDPRGTGTGAIGSGLQNYTMMHNFDLGQEQSREVDKALVDFADQVLQLRDYCMVHLVSNGEWQNLKAGEAGVSHKKCFINYCYTCVNTGHGAKECPALSSDAISMMNMEKGGSRKCYACGIGKCRGEDVHKIVGCGYGSRRICKIYQATQLGFHCVIKTRLRTHLLGDQEDSIKWPEIKINNLVSEEGRRKCRAIIQWLGTEEPDGSGLNIMRILDAVFKKKKSMT